MGILEVVRPIVRGHVPAPDAMRNLVAPCLSALSRLPARIVTPPPGTHRSLVATHGWAEGADISARTPPLTSTDRVHPCYRRVWRYTLNDAKCHVPLQL